MNPFFVLNLPLTLFCVFALFVSGIWLVRAVKRLVRTDRRENLASQTTFLATDDPMQQIADAQAHLDASKRHIAALEEKLDQIQSQLKRRPLL